MHFISHQLQSVWGLGTNCQTVWLRVKDKQKKAVQRGIDPLMELEQNQVDKNAEVQEKRNTAVSKQVGIVPPL